MLEGMQLATHGPMEQPVQSTCYSTEPEAADRMSHETRETSKPEGVR